MLLISAAMVATFIRGTQAVTTHAALKATYFMPMTVVFSFWFALGVRSLGNWKPILALLVAIEGAVLAGVSVLVFTQGLILEPPADPRVRVEVWENLYGVVYYAGGDRGTARKLFSSSARGHWRPALENLATLDYEEGNLPQAIRSLDEAARVLGGQVSGVGVDAQREVNMTAAEYFNSLAVIFHATGALDTALTVANSAVSLEPDFPEPYYNLGMLELLQAVDHGTADAEAKRKLIQEASEHLATAVHLDPGFVQAAGALGVSQALLGDCGAGLPRLKWALQPPPGTRREFPVETGRGDMSMSIGRRKLIAQLPGELLPDYQLRLCEAPSTTTGPPVDNRLACGGGDTLYDGLRRHTLGHRGHGLGQSWRLQHVRALPGCGSRGRAPE
jgi:tetratricopeptide (TPR) repeat protein